MAIHALRQRDFLKKGNRIAVRRLLQQPAISAHRHEFFEIVIIFSGNGTHVTGNFRRKIEAGDVMVINRKRAHGYAETRRLNLANILIREEVLKRIGRELQSLPGYHSLFNADARHWQMNDGANRLKLSPMELEQIEEWVQRLEEESASEAPGSPFIAEAYLTLIIAVLARKQPRPTHVVRRPLATFGKLQSWIEKNLDCKLSVADLARQAGMSERSFYRSFEQILGSTPADYLIQLRVQRATELLREVPRLRRISEIAEACGFEDSNYFSRCFRRLKGCSPREFSEL